MTMTSDSEARVSPDGTEMIWHFIREQIDDGRPVTLLYVLESHGSSPGRRGFMMAASIDACVGTIGGGIMEYKLVELSRAMMMRGEVQILLKTQYHDKEHPMDQSGMICSGMQRVAIIPITKAHREVIHTIPMQGALEISPSGIAFDPQETEELFKYENDEQWYYRAVIGRLPRLHIIGGGHVSLALSELMHRLGFIVHVYDDRPHLNTVEENRFAHKRHLISYDQIGDVLPDDPQDFVVIMTIGYRDDKVVLRQLIHRHYRYLGMLGSAEKIRTLFAELHTEGIPLELLDRVHAPVGLPIASRTAYEIAVSIAAQIIAQKNYNPPEEQ